MREVFLPMNKLFSPDNPVMILLSRIFDLILLNACFVITCIPVFTIGPALCALYNVTLKMADGDFGDTAQNYFSSFKQNFKQGVILWLILFGLCAFFSADLYVIFSKLPSSLRPFQIPVWILLFITISAVLYSFPMMARYEQSNLQLIKNSLLMGLGNLPLTVFMTVILGVIADLSIHNGSLLILFFSIGLFIGCALLARIFSVFLRRAFMKASGEPDDKEDPPER